MTDLRKPVSTDIMHLPAGERLLASTPSAHGTVAVSEDPQGWRTLWIGDSGVRQSRFNPAAPLTLEFAYSRVMALAPAFPSLPPERMLMLGLGGGSVPSFWQRHYPRVIIDIVEINPAVTDLAEQFMGFRRSPALRVLQGDAAAYLQVCRDEYGIICHDAYGPRGMPPHLRAPEFFAAMRARLAAGGVALVHLWDGRVNPFYETTLTALAAAFTSVAVWESPGPGGRVAAGLTVSEGFDRDALQTRLAVAQCDTGVCFDLVPCAAPVVAIAMPVHRCA